MIRLEDLPTINAALNAISLVLLLYGYAMIRRKRVLPHKRAMIAAYCTSIVFLAGYLTHRFTTGDIRFGGTGFIRPVYFFILITHVSLAVTVPVLSTWTLLLGLRGRIERHRRLARVTLPIWLYVSVTGIVVYVLLFCIYQPLPNRVE